MLNYKIHMQPTRIWKESGAKTHLSWSTLPFKSLGSVNFFFFLRNYFIQQECIYLINKDIHNVSK